MTYTKPQSKGIYCKTRSCGWNCALECKCPNVGNQKQQGKQELAKMILTEGYAVGDERYIAFEVARLKSQIKEAKRV